MSVGGLAVGEVVLQLVDAHKLLKRDVSVRDQLFACVLRRLRWNSRELVQNCNINHTNVVSATNRPPMVLNVNISVLTFCSFFLTSATKQNNSPAAWWLVSARKVTNTKTKPSMIERVVANGRKTRLHVWQGSLREKYFVSWMSVTWYKCTDHHSKSVWNVTNSSVCWTTESRSQTIFSVVRQFQQGKKALFAIRVANSLPLWKGTRAIRTCVCQSTPDSQPVPKEEHFS